VQRMKISDRSGLRPGFPPGASVCLAVCAILALVWLLSGCSVATGTGGAGLATSAPTSAPTTTGSQLHEVASNACPVAQAPQDAISFKADVIVNEGNGATQTLTLRQAQRLEIHLDSQVKWELRVEDPQRILLGATSQGWYDAASKTCVWRFIAQSTGDAQLVFSGTPPCPFLKTCPSSDRSATYRVTIQ
jgi:hypothetical protein